VAVSKNRACSLGKTNIDSPKCLKMVEIGRTRLVEPGLAT
jgi:hypothetical protein